MLQFYLTATYQQTHRYTGNICLLVIALVFASLAGCANNGGQTPAPQSSDVIGNTEPWSVPTTVSSDARSALNQFPTDRGALPQPDDLVYLVTHIVTFSESPRAISKARFRRHSGATSRKRNAADGSWRLARREPPNSPAAALQFLKRTRHSQRTAPRSERIGRL